MPLILFETYLDDNFMWFSKQMGNKETDSMAILDAFVYFQLHAVYWSIIKVKTMFNIFNTRFLEEVKTKSARKKGINQIETETNVYVWMYRFLTVPQDLYEEKGYYSDSFRLLYETIDKRNCFTLLLIEILSMNYLAQETFI